MRVFVGLLSAQSKLGEGSHHSMTACFLIWNHKSHEYNRKLPGAGLENSISKYHSGCEFVVTNNMCNLETTRTLSWPKTSHSVTSFGQVILLICQLCLEP